jgi:hypothetical protein
MNPKSWKLACKRKGDTDWSFNGLRFATKDACESYGADLYSRWMALEKYEAQPSDDEPNR